MSKRTTADEALDDVTPEGLVAGRTVGALLVLTGIGIVAVSWDEVWARCGELAGECVSRSSGAVMLTLVALVVATVGVVAWWRTGRRPVDDYGSSRWVWALAAMLVVAAALIASRIPAFTCARGRLDDLLDLCMHPPSTSEPASWVLAKQAVVALGAVGGILVATRARWVRATAPLTALVWIGAMTWLLTETMVLNDV
jgi:hypothetical protein